MRCIGSRLSMHARSANSEPAGRDAVRGPALPRRGSGNCSDETSSTLRSPVQRDSFVAATVAAYDYSDGTLRAAVDGGMGPGVVDEQTLPIRQTTTTTSQSACLPACRNVLAAMQGIFRGRQAALEII